MEGLGFSNYDSNLKTNNQLPTSTLNTCQSGVLWNYTPNDLFNPTRTSQSGITQCSATSSDANTLSTNVVAALGSSSGNVDPTNILLFNWDAYTYGS